MVKGSELEKIEKERKERAKVRKKLYKKIREVADLVFNLEPKIKSITIIANTGKKEKKIDNTYLVNGIEVKNGKRNRIRAK